MLPNWTKCRSCGHYRDGEALFCINRHDSFGSPTWSYVIDCSCKELIPADNLEYLEWKLDNNG